MKKNIILALILITTTISAKTKIQVDSICYRITSRLMPFTVEVADQNKYSFNNYLYLTKLLIPDSITYNDTTYCVTSIGKSAFANCTSLTTVVIPTTVKTIQKYAFQNCTSLSNISLSSGLERIYDYAFHGCASLANITFPNTVTYIGNSVFQYCSSITSIMLPENITRIGQHTFYGCRMHEEDFVNNTSLNEKQFKYWGANIIKKSPTDTIFSTSDTIQSSILQ